MISRTTLGILALQFLASVANAQSFECRYASTDVELVICGNKSLSLLDSQLATAFYHLRDRLFGAQRAALDQSQQRWILRRGRCHYNAACIARVYEVRIDELAAWN
jgi:uncharacterized protein